MTLTTNVEKLSMLQAFCALQEYVESSEERKGGLYKDIKITHFSKNNLGIPMGFKVEIIKENGSSIVERDENLTKALIKAVNK